MLTALRFRVARELGYGVSAGMARRCLERLDGEGITGTLTVLRVVSDDHPAATQGPGLADRRAVGMSTSPEPQVSWKAIEADAEVFTSMVSQSGM